MHKTLLIIGLIIVVALLSILYVVLDVIAPLMSVWVVIILASFAVIFGFLVGIKYMSQI
jgi:hypothetical protein